MKTLLIIVFIIISTFVVDAQGVNRFNKSLEKVKTDLKQLHPNNQNLFLTMVLYFKTI